MQTFRFLAALLLTVASSVQAQAVTFEEWFLVDAKDKSGDVIAATSTEDGKELLGYRCMLRSNTCQYVLMTESTCEADEKYPLMLNSSVGASTLMGTCFKSSGPDQLVLAPYTLIEKAIKGGQGLIGFAIPMASGQFRAIRFSVKGGSDAIEAAERLGMERRKSSPNHPSSTTF